MCEWAVCFALNCMRGSYLLLSTALRIRSDIGHFLSYQTRNWSKVINLLMVICYPLMPEEAGVNFNPVLSAKVAEIG